MKILHVWNKYGPNMRYKKNADLNSSACQNKSSAHYTRELHSYLSSSTMVLTIGVTPCSDWKKDAWGVKFYASLYYNYEDDLVGSWLMIQYFTQRFNHRQLTVIIRVFCYFFFTLRPISLYTCVASIFTFVNTHVTSCLLAVDCSNVPCEKKKSILSKRLELSIRTCSVKMFWPSQTVESS